MRSTLFVALVSTVAFACSQSPSGAADHQENSGLSGSSPSKQGRVSVSQYPESPFFNVRANGVFSATATTSTEGCTSVRVGSACSLTKCSGSPLAPSDNSESAGDIAIGTASQNLAMNFNDQLSVYGSQVTQDKPLFLAGETVYVHAAGGADVPAFKTSLVAPARITLSSPTVTSSGCAFPQRHAGADLELAWSGGAVGDTVNVLFVGSSSESLACSFDADAGTAAVPYAGGLEHIFAGKSAVFSSSTGRMKVVDAGDYRVEVSLQQQMMGCYFTPN